jgi:hypothetical protein
VRIKDMLWIEDIVKNTLALPFLTNSKIDMVSFVDHPKVIVKRMHFSLSKWTKWK